MITHVGLMALSILKCKAESKISLKLDAIDEFMLKKFSVEKIKSSSWTLFLKFSSFWIIPVVLNIFSLVSVVSFGAYTELWTRSMPGKFSAQIKCIHIAFYLELLQQRLSALDTVLYNLSCQKRVSDQLKQAKKLYTGLLEVNFMICRCFGLDLVFVVTLSILVVVINTYWTFLVASGLESNSSFFGNIFLKKFRNDL